MANIRHPAVKIEISSEQAQRKTVCHWRRLLMLMTPPEGDHLRLLSPADKYLMNSSYGNDPNILKKLGPATVTINPIDAKLRNIAEGDSVSMFNETGKTKP